MRLRVFVLTISVLACAAAQAQEQEWNLYASCRDAGFSEREREDLEEDGKCDPSGLAVIHAAFAAPPLAELAGARGQAVRVTVTDGYGNITVMAEVVRRAGADAPIAIARGRGDPGRRPPEVMEAELDGDAWTAIAQRVRDQAHARAVPPWIDWSSRRRRMQEGEEEAITICLHGWGVMIETQGFGRSRVIERNSCDEDSDDVFDLGWRTTRYVFGAFGECAFLDEQFYRNDAARLSFCLGLSGEIAVAASATNAIRPFMYERFAAERLRYVLAEDFSLTLDGEPAVTGADAAFTRWRNFVATGDFETYFDTASGAEDDRGRQSAQLNLLLIDDAWPEENQTRFAEIVQNWRREDEVWLMQSAQVGPWQVVTFADDESQ